MEFVESVICYWKWTALAGKWSMVDSYGVDSDGYRINPPDGVKITSLDETDFFMWPHTDSQRPLGRCVTIWAMSVGVSLVEFSPPEMCGWLSPLFANNLIASPQWMDVIDYGDLLSGTTEAARKILKLKAGD